MTKQQQCKPRGRPMSFERQDALEKAMMVFWKQGYEGTSLADLTAAMGINKPSMYGCFGNKEALFRQVVEHYIHQRETSMQAALAQPSIKAAMTDLLSTMCFNLTDKHTPNGCMVIQGALSCSEQADDIKNMLIDYRQKYEITLVDRFTQAMNEGELAADQDASQMAKYIATVQQGLSVQATSGASYDDLMAVVNIALNGMNLPEAELSHIA